MDGTKRDYRKVIENGVACPIPLGMIGRNAT